MPTIPSFVTPVFQTADEILLNECRTRSLDLLRRNLTPGGILAATPGAQAEARSYTRVFARDAAICILAMAGSRDPELEAGAVASLDSLACGQAANGQIPKYVEPSGKEADFWYTGCIDASLWFLLAVDHVRRHSADAAVKTRWQPQVEAAVRWLQAQEHPHFGLLQQNEASDWADIMPRSGFVLYASSLWYRVKLLYELPHLEETHYWANQILAPHQEALPTYRRARLLQHYARRGRSDPGLYLSFVNFSFAGHEGDVLGNTLAVLYGLAPESMGNKVVDTLLHGNAHTPYPGRAVLSPITRHDPLWRPYMARHQQNHPHQYHNGGIWPMVGGFLVMALALMGRCELARDTLLKLAQANAAADWRFTEWFHGQTLQPCGMPGQSWNAATFLLAQQAVEARAVAVKAQ